MHVLAKAGRLFELDLSNLQSSDLCVWIFVERLFLVMLIERLVAFLLTFTPCS